MEQNGQSGKKQIALNIVSSKSKHKGFGAGSIDLNNLSPVIIDAGEAKIDIGAMHAKSKVERGIKFSADKADVPNGRQVWLVWVAVDRTPEGQLYAGATACEMWIDTEARRGWKILADHVNKMDYAMKRRIMLDELGAEEKAALKKLLIAHNEDWWNASPEELKQALES
ncbi:YwhD family protein [Paenibacillus urinalis]|uniref:YwhD family protein n=1 Tax=Paenibacillus urinalis TaxID=521520 RepID=A0ABY7XCR2_9BACL|nr:YwhD family protein [Paenibacillus urinalis]WDH98850.1 YwhD family protein [Paenibacillus urinalis]WDI02546.1 YwhD family protein [Paenibacillus urinalis]